MQRRVEQPDRHRQPRHRLEDALEVALLEGQEPVERGAACRLVVREDHLLDDRQALLAEEHVLRAAEPDSLSAELARLRRVGGRVGVRVHLEPPNVVRPAEDRLEIVVQAGRHELDRRRGSRCPVPPSTVITSPSATAWPAIVATPLSRSIVRSDASGDTGLPHPARDERGV